MLIKRPLADGRVEVTFRMALEGISRLSLLGDFNHWNAAANPLVQTGSGEWSATLRLPVGEYRYRYIASGSEWLNDPEAVAAAAKASAVAPRQKRATKTKAEREAGVAPKKRAPRKKSAK